MEIGIIADSSDVINAQFINDELAFLLEINRNVLGVYNITNVSNCVELDSYSLSYIHDIELDLERELVFVTAANGVNILNYSDPCNLEWLSSYLNYTSSTFIQLKEELLYIGAEADGLQIVNVSDPLNPVMIGRWDDGVGDVGPVYIIDDYNFSGISNDFAFVGTRLPNIEAPPTILDLKLLNATDPSNVTFVSIIDTGGESRGGAPRAHIGDIVYLNDYNYGLKILNFSDPFNVTVIGSFNRDGFYNDVDVYGDHVAFLADDNEGLKVVNCVEPENPFMLGQYDHEWRTIRVVLGNECVYLATLGGGIRILIAYSDETISINLSFILSSMLIGLLGLLLGLKKKIIKKNT